MLLRSFSLCSFYFRNFVLFQANSNAREGRVMIFNLVEAAREFLSEIVPVGQPISVRLLSTLLVLDS